jgi:uncharacterized protein YfiM (DUF2279 family)
VNPLILCLAVTAASCGGPGISYFIFDPDHTAAYTADHADPVPVPPRADAWLAEDKLQHFGMSFAATAFTYAGARTLLEPDASLMVAGTTAFLAGIAKEIHDARAGRWFSFKDLVWDAAGVALGLTFVHQIR